MAGVAFGTQVPWFGVCIAATAVAVWYCRPHNWLSRCQLVTLVGWLCLLWAIGWWRYSAYLPLANNLPYNQSVNFIGQIVQPPRMSGAKQRLIVSTTQWAGKIQLTTARYPVYQYGDRLNITCDLQPPQPFDDFAYDRYLARYGIVALCQPFGELSVDIHERAQGWSFLRSLYQFRFKINTTVEQLWPEPIASLMLGVITGEQAGIPPDIVTAFRRTGTVHILVVSGMHVMILTALWLHCTRQVLTPAVRYLSLISILIAFAIITGLSASVIRACIMGVVPVLARLSGRRPVVHYSLALIAAGMTAHNPYVLVHDVGFQLSFLATIGLLYFQPLCQRLCRPLPNIFWLRETVSTSLAATITTTPLVLSVFGTLSLVSIVTNIIVVPISTIMLLAGSVLVAVSQIFPKLAFFFSYSIWLVVRFMVQWVQWWSQLPGAYLENLTVPWPMIVALYGGISLYILWRIHTASSLSSVASS